MGISDGRHAGRGRQEFAVHREMQLLRQRLWPKSNKPSQAQKNIAKQCFHC
jgi:hypothetical protein